MSTQSLLMWIVCIFGLVTCSIYKFGTVETVEGIQISKTERAKSMAWVYTDDEVFENTDSWVHGKFDTSDIQKKAIESEGKTCTLEVYGARLPILSMHRNILELTCEE